MHHHLPDAYIGGVKGPLNIQIIIIKVSLSYKEIHMRLC